MARTRNIKPGFFKNEELAECDPLARIAFAGLWTIADRDGRLEDRPKRIKAEVLPYDNADMDALLTDLERRCFITRYEVAGSRYIQVVNWAKHQQPHVKEQTSTIPAPPDYVPAACEVVPDNEDAPYLTGASTVSVPCNTGTSTYVAPLDTSSLNLDTSSLEGTAQAPPPAPPKRKQPRQTSYPDDFCVTADMEAWARAEVPGLDVDAATDEWSTSMRSNRTRYRYTDWGLAWQNAMRRAAQWAAERGGKNNATNRPKQLSKRERAISDGFEGAFGVSLEQVFGPANGRADADYQASPVRKQLGPGEAA